jgi:hypothetical protein
VTKTPQGINKDTGVSSNNPKVTASATTANSVSLNLDPSLGKLTNWNVEGFASSWKPVDPSKLNRGGVSVTAESGGKGVRRGINPPGFLSASQLKMPLSATSLTVKGLEQSNFQTFSTGGNTSKNGANICITLSFA